MRTTIDAEIDLEDCETWELAEALVLVAGGHESAHLCITRVSKDKRPRFMGSSSERDHAREIRDLRAQVRDALALIDMGRREEGMWQLAVFAAEETQLTEWQRIKEGKHPFLSFRKPLDA